VHKITFIKDNKEELDKAKQALAIRANLIHFLDAVWVHNFILKFLDDKVNINVLPIHDCFGVIMSDIENLNKYVRLALKSFFEDKNNLYKLLIQLEHGKKMEKKRKLELEKASKFLIGDLQISLEGTSYLIFPG